VGAPKAKVIVLTVPGSGGSAPVMSSGVSPVGKTSGLVVTLLKSVPLTAVPPSVKSTVTVLATSLTVPPEALAT
jgi:hypothetical protein